MSEFAVPHSEAAGREDIPPPFAVGPAVSSRQLEMAHEGLLPGSRKLRLPADIMRYVNERDKDVRIKALDLIDVFSDFAESQATRPHRMVLFDASPTQWEKNWRPIVEKLYTFSGACLPWHKVRNDVADRGEPTGTVITAGMIDEHAFCFIERVVPKGAGRVMRRLEAVSADYDGYIAALNEYSLVEGQDAGRVLDHAGATLDERETVLSAASRTTAPDRKQLLEMLAKERGDEQQSTGVFARLGSLVGIGKPRT